MWSWSSKESFISIFFPVLYVQCVFFFVLVNKVSKEVWATILALIWLHGFNVDAQVEWELLALKAASWLRAQNGNSFQEVLNICFSSLVKIMCFPPLITMFACLFISASCVTECVDAGNALLGCSVQKDALKV